MPKQRVTLSISVPMEEIPLVDEAAKIAKQEGTNLSQIFRKAIMEYLEEHRQREGDEK